LAPSLIEILELKQLELLEAKALMLDSDRKLSQFEQGVMSGKDQLLAELLSFARLIEISTGSVKKPKLDK
jgi:hypothetical protein